MQLRRVLLFPLGDGWCVTAAGDSARHSFATEGEALDFARELASQNAPCRVEIYGPRMRQLGSFVVATPPPGQG